MSQAVDILKTAPSAKPSDSLLSNDPQCEAPAHRAGLAGHIPVKVLEGRPLRSHCARDRGVTLENRNR